MARDIEEADIDTRGADRARGMHPILARTLVHKRREIDDRKIGNRHTLRIAREGAVVEIRVCATLIGLNKVDHRNFSLLAANAGHWPKQYLFLTRLRLRPTRCMGVCGIY